MSALYLDTGILLKLFYPEPPLTAWAESLVGAGPVWFSELHELEITNALQRKVFSEPGSAPQVNVAFQNLAQLVEAGVLLRPVTVNWPQVWRTAAELSKQFAPTLGTRSLDVLHCVVAQALGAASFISSDARQIALARQMGLPVVHP